jgi:hypothetical protein
MASAIGNKVNVNPKPPNAPKGLTGAQPQNQGKSLTNAKSQAAQKSYASNQANLQAKNQASANAISSAASAAAAPNKVVIHPIAAAEDPRDSSYWETLTNLEFNKNQEIKNLETQGVFDQTAYSREKAESDRLMPVEQRNLRENANVAGTIYSSATTNAANELGIQQSNRNSSLEEAYQKLLFERAKEKQGVEGNFKLASSQDYESAIERNINKAREKRELEPIEYYE